MAYVLGYLYADGNMEDASYLRGKYVRVSSVDRVTIERIRRWLGSEHTIVSLAPRSYHSATRYLLRIGSTRLYESLYSRGLTPHKSLTIQFPSVPEKYLSPFVLGYLDGDGCVFFEKGTGSKGQKIVKRLAVIFTSGSRQFLMQLSECLGRHLTIKKKDVYESRRSYQLRYSTYDSIKILQFLYQRDTKLIALERKHAIFEEYMNWGKQHGAVAK